MSFLQMSISGGIFILAVVIIRAAAVNRLPQKTFLVLWNLVLLRLLIPFSIPSMFSIYSLIDRNVSEVHNKSLMKYLPPAPGAPLVLPEKTHSVSMGQTRSVSVWFAIWVTGMIILAVFFIVSYVRCRMEFAMSIPVQNDFTKQWLMEHPLKRKVLLRQSDKISAPLTYGMLKPVILLPKKTDWENKDRLLYVLEHEYVHIRRFDSITKLVLALALCIHWFNPMVWVMYVLFNRDIELVCDESVVRHFGEASKSAYARTLIHMEAEKSGLLPFGSHFSKNSIEERITAIMKTKKITAFIIVLSVIIIGSVTVFFATSVRQEGKDFAEDDSAGPDPNRFALDAPALPPTAALIAEISDDSIVVDPVEYVTNDDVERKKELIEVLDLKNTGDLEDGENFLDGYYIYNPYDETEKWKLTDETVYKFIDWDCKYTGSEFPEYYTTTDRKIFKEYIATYGGGKMKMPLFFEVRDGVVKRIVEKFIA